MPFENYENKGRKNRFWKVGESGYKGLKLITRPISRFVEYVKSHDSEFRVLEEYYH